MENNRLYLKTPDKDELWYRIKLLGDADTMSFNPGGCYHITQEQAAEWYDLWIGVPGKFYAYITLSDDNTFVGEVNVHFDADTGLHMVGIIIEESQKGKGYAEEALRLLAKYAFNEMKLDKIADKFPATRIAAEKIFTKVGFVRQGDDLLVLKKADFETAI
ncbi:MAG: GNAT family N-acetyltransferase [Alphaproteobacteria bacterium]|nr:GNAT family N-acetyltransferase [Alphaproteobacteria bacterium]